MAGHPIDLERALDALRIVAVNSRGGRRINLRQGSMNGVPAVGGRSGIDVGTNLQISLRQICNAGGERMEIEHRAADQQGQAATRPDILHRRECIADEFPGGILLSRIANILDYELELGIFVGRGNPLGEAIPVSSAEQHIFGLCLLNDWSARDLQGWEAQPLGPFLGKNFATTISPWVVTLEALAPFRAPLVRSAGEPAMLAYLDSPAQHERGAVAIEMEVYLQSAAMRAAGAAGERISRSNFRDAYWSIGQMIAHHTVGGCNLLPGDLLGSGTQSGPTPAEAGSLLELSVGGAQPITLSDGERRAFLADGDRVELRAACRRQGYARIGFGSASGIVHPARDRSDD